MPGDQRKMDPLPDCGEQTYKGSGRLANKVALVTGADSVIGRAGGRHRLLRAGFASTMWPWTDLNAIDRIDHD